MSHDGKGLSALYARDTSASNESNNSSRKRSRFDEVGGSVEFGRDSREDPNSRERERESKDRGGHRDSRDSRDRSRSSRDHRDYERERDRDRDRSAQGHRDGGDRESSNYSQRERDDGRERERDYKRHRDDRDYESRDRDRERRDRSRERGDRDSREGRYSRDNYRDYPRDNYRDYRDNRRPGNNNVEIPFDRFLRLSPWRGPVTPLEERPRHLKNWDVAPSGFERISADKAKLTGLFPPPGNIAKSSNYVPPTLDPARAAMFQLLNKDNNNIPSSSIPGTAADNNNSTNLPANLLKQAKRFYVGNLPFDFSESKLMNFLEINLKGLSGSNDKAEEKILNINVSSDRSYAFVECRTPEDASLAMNLDGVIFDGSQLKIRRPKEYHLAMTSGLLSNNNTGVSSSSTAANSTSTGTSGSASNPITANSQINKRQLIISGIPEILTSEHVKSLLSLVAEVRYFLLLKDRESDKSLGVAVFEFVEDGEGEEWSGPFLKHSGGTLFMGPFEMKFIRVYDILLKESDDSSSSEIKDDYGYLRTLLSVYNLQPGYATAPSSTPILQLLNIVTKESLQADYDAIYEDLRSELSKFTNAAEAESSESNSFELVIPRPSEDDQLVPGIGKVFVRFGSVEEAARAASELAGRIFDGHTCIVSFYPPEKYEKKLF